MKILLIEDDSQICEVITHYFKNHGSAVTSIHDGKTALEKIQDGLQEFDLILLDIMLPEIDGFTLCREIRKKSDIPIIFITARGREEDIL
ncbi:MAG TPA: DNA-binding response regulator, partial [Ruminococcus sp.]|nr:DNA-binding response regulator [Ruminococcus sp.]